LAIHDQGDGRSLADLLRENERNSESIACVSRQTAYAPTMDKPWYRKLFGRPPEGAMETAEVNADHEDAEVQFRLGLKFANDKSAAQDYAQAAEWYRKAADQSHALAQFNLGVMYARGQGVDRDEAAAALWLGKAAQQGDAGAQYHLGMRHHRASMNGQPREAVESRVEAFKWLRLAAAQGYQGSAAACEFVTLGMSREEVTDGNQRTAAFVAGKPDSAETQ
jgi:TPR repeat protein